MNKAYIIADDLTGAMDTGVQLVRAGQPACLVMPEGTAGPLPRQYKRLVLDTESRNLDSRAAANAVAAHMQRAEEAGYRLFYEKIDSTLRGNPGAEIEAALRISGYAAALIAPAMPANGRVTRYGRQYVHGRPLAETEFARDPYKPIKTSDIREILTEQARLSSGLLGLSVLRQGVEAAAEAVRSMLLQGRQLIVCDAETAADFSTLSVVIRQFAGQCLPCGAAELLSFLLDGGAAPPVKASQDPPGGQNGAPCLVVSGSPAGIAKQQIAFVRAHDGAKVFDCHRLALASSEGQLHQQMTDALCLQAREALDAGCHVVIDAAGSSKTEIFTAAGGDIRQMRQDGQQIQLFLAEITGRLLSGTHAACGGLVCFGGDTARNLLQRLHAATIHIEQEVERFIPAGRLLDGAAAGLRLVTKAGGFGDEKTLQRIFEHLRR